MKDPDTGAEQMVVLIPPTFKTLPKLNVGDRIFILNAKYGCTGSYGYEITASIASGCSWCVYPRKKKKNAKRA
ncbi:hypothetical protein BGZ79_010399 [Entomortierella chlamydospora]|nr:hypothetical protein BGZ79_010399 [Entomortierella chlamydospora]